MTHLALAMAALIALLTVTGLRSMASEESRERLDRVPFALLRLARWRVPRQLRVKLYDEEWMPELEAIQEELRKTPLTWLTAGTWFSLGLLVHARQISRMRDLSDIADPASESAQQAATEVAALRDALEQARTSRARIFEAELAERRRWERDLHDGALGHLLAITARLTAAMTTTSDPEAVAAFSQARDGLKAVLAELRDLAHGIHPAVLSHTGLAIALEEVTDRLPLPVKIIVPEFRLGSAVELTLYFVACEALTNVVRHASADSARVTVQAEESSLKMEIEDDGVGGVTLSSIRGRGLANIVDRVSALEGTVTIDSPPGHGTRLMVTIPRG